METTGQWNLLNHNDDDVLPTLGDYNIIAEFENGSIETAHVEDYFKLIGNGLNEKGIQQYTKYYLHATPTIIAWMYLPKSSNQTATNPKQQ